MTLTSKCNCCGDKEESFNHLFFGGTWAMKMWDFLSDIFQCHKARDMKTLIGDWIEPNKIGDVGSNRRMGLAMVGLHYIWKWQNNKRHGEQGTFNSYEIHKWAGNLTNMIPKRNVDSRHFRGILMILRIPQDIHSTMEGKWACWRPDTQGNTMDVFVHEASNKSVILIRDNKGGFIFADRMEVQPIRNNRDLEKIFVAWTRKAAV